jgi:hypothetical protein
MKPPRWRLPAVAIVVMASKASSAAEGSLEIKMLFEGSGK